MYNLGHDRFVLKTTILFFFLVGWHLKHLGVSVTAAVTAIDTSGIDTICELRKMLEKRSLKVKPQKKRKKRIHIHIHIHIFIYID